MKNNINAFTLLEAVVATFIFVLLMLALYATYDVFYKTSKQQIAYIQTSEKLRPAMEQLEGMIADVGYGIDEAEIQGPTTVNRTDKDTLIDAAALSVYNNTNHKLLSMIKTTPETTSIPEISIKSLNGEDLYAGNFIVYDSQRFSSDTEVKQALGLPKNYENFWTIRTDLDKKLIEGPTKGLPSTTLADGNIIFVCKPEATSTDDYYYIKTIALDNTSNENNSDYSYCAPNTFNLQVVRAGINVQPLIPCVAYFNVDFACASGESIKWQKEICNKIENLRIVRLGLIVQSGFRNREMIYHGKNPTLIFPSLGTPYNKEPIKYNLIIDENNIKNDQRYYKWEIIERFIATSNLML